MKVKSRDTVPIIMIILVVTKIVGFLKIRIIAQFFGASSDLDLFWAAFTIPDTLFNILMIGALNAAVIPSFSEVLHTKGEKKLNGMLLSVSLLFVIAAVFMSAVSFVFSSEIADLIVSGKLLVGVESIREVREGDTQLLATLIRIMLISPILLGISSLITAYLQVHKRFFISVIAPLVYNVTTIILSVILVKYFNQGVKGLAWAVVIGSLMHVSSQVPAILFKLKENGVAQGILKSSEYAVDIVKMLKLALPRIVGLAGEQVNVFINTMISFTLSAGALSAYNFAVSLHLFPIQIIGGSISTVALPHLTESYVKGDIKIFREIFVKSIQKILFLILPSISILVVLRLPLVRLAYGVGEFDWWATVVTSWCLALLGFSIVGQSIATLCVRIFFAMKKSKTVLFVSLLTIVINVAGSYYFTNFFSHYLDWRPIVTQTFDQIKAAIFHTEGSIAQSTFITFKQLLIDLKFWFTSRNTYDAAVGGLALSTSVSFMFETVLYLVLLNRKFKIFRDRNILSALFKKIAVSISMISVMYIVYRFSDQFFDTSRTISVIIVTFITIFSGGIVYFGLSAFVKVEEMSIVRDWLKKILPIINNLKKILGRNGKFKYQK